MTSRRPSSLCAQRATVPLALLAALSVAACAPQRGLLDALQTNYRGFEELSPKLSPGKSGASFPYTPGTLLPVSAVTDGDQRAWTALTDLHCGPAQSLTTLRYWKRTPYRYRAGMRATGRAQGDAKNWLSERAGVSLASLAGVSEVIVEVVNVRSYEPRPRALAVLNASASDGCILPPDFAGSSVRRVRGVIVGDVRVRLYFEQGIDLIARAQIADQLSLAFGFGFARLSESEIAGRNVAFGVKWQ